MLCPDAVRCDWSDLAKLAESGDTSPPSTGLHRYVVLLPGSALCPLMEAAAKCESSESNDLDLTAYMMILFYLDDYCDYTTVSLGCLRQSLPSPMNVLCFV